MITPVSAVNVERNLVVNGNFESPEPAPFVIEGWTRWYDQGSGVGNHSGDYAAGTPVTNDLCVWANDGGIEQTVTGITEGTYLLSADFINSLAAPLTGGARAIVKVEMSNNGVFWWAQEMSIDVTAPSSEWQNEWMYITVTPNELGQHADSIRVIAMLWRADGGGNAYIDNISLTNVVHRAYNPDPVHGAIVDSSLNTLGWSNPDPNLAGDPITCDVWLRESAVALDDPNFAPVNAGLYRIVHGQAGNSAAITPPLQEGMFYYWRVDCIDPSVGTTVGTVWEFTTGDVPPVADAGPDQYVWLTMDDGTPADGMVTVTLEGSYQDDGTSAVTTQWVVGTKEPAGAVVTIANPNAAVTTATIDSEGWFQLVFQVSDAANTRDNDMYVGVYDSACTAAHEDPADIAVKYPNGSGDIDGDCDVDLDDFALMATSWMDCMSDKLGCAQ